jgi:hypothetical protein
MTEMPDDYDERRFAREREMLREVEHRPIPDWPGPREPPMSAWPFWTLAALYVLFAGAVACLLFVLMR